MYNLYILFIDGLSVVNLFSGFNFDIKEYEYTRSVGVFILLTRLCAIIY